MKKRYQNQSEDSLSKKAKACFLDENKENTPPNGNLRVLVENIKITEQKKEKLVCKDNLENLVNLLVCSAIKEYDSEALLKLIKMKNFDPNFCYNENGNSFVYMVTQLPNRKKLSNGNIENLSSGMEMISILLDAKCSLNKKDIECLNNELEKTLDTSYFEDTIIVNEDKDELANNLDDFASFLDSHRFCNNSSCLGDSLQNN